MPTLRNYHILISHSWTYSAQYNTVCSWFDNTAYFTWSNYSVCCNKPLDTKNDAELKEKLRNRISSASCIVVLAGMYATYSKWIDFEIETAQTMNTPIIGVKPWGQERVPLKIQNASCERVGWNSASIINAVRKYAV